MRRTESIQNENITEGGKSFSEIRVVFRLSRHKSRIFNEKNHVPSRVFRREDRVFCEWVVEESYFSEFSFQFRHDRL